MHYHKVLIIDDEQEICLLLRNMLNDFGYSAVFACTLVKGYEMYVDEKPEIVFIDLNLPDGSGFSLIKLIRETDADVKIIVISAQDGEKERLIASDSGTNYFIGKPLRRDRVMEAMQMIETAFQTLV